MTQTVRAAPQSDAARLDVLRRAIDYAIGALETEIRRLQENGEAKPLGSSEYRAFADAARTATKGLIELVAQGARLDRIAPPGDDANLFDALDLENARAEIESRLARLAPGA